MIIVLYPSKSIIETDLESVNRPQSIIYSRGKIKVLESCYNDVAILVLPINNSKLIDRFNSRKSIIGSIVWSSDELI